MNHETVTRIQADLLQGTLPDSRADDLAAAVRSIADSLASPAAPLIATQVRKVADALNRARHFVHTKTIGEAWRATRGSDPAIQKHHAQALIELGAFEAADALLDKLLEGAVGGPDLEFVRQIPEYRGLRGRVRKQRFVQSGDLNLLVAATNEYLAQYSARPQFWHGINIVALRMREEREGIPPRTGDTAATLAAQVLDLALAEYAANRKDPWPSATVSEASLAMYMATRSPDWCDRAELWLHRFLNHPNTDAFSIESYFRQLREVWGGDAMAGASCADRLAAIVQRHVARTQQRWSVDPARVLEMRDRPEVLEKNFSGEKSFTVETLRKMLGLCPSIGCVIDATGARLGTGFLMAGPAMGFASHDLVFVTNAHVISTTWDTSIRPQDANVTFEVESAAAGVPVPHAIDQVLFSSDPGELSGPPCTPEKLDVTIVTLRSHPSGITGLIPAANVPLPSPKTKAFVVGHPASGALQFALHDSVLLDVSDDERLMHYRTPTDPGSSGSPVFNWKWEVIALHHAGSPDTPRLHGQGEYEANEGITMRAIRRQLGIAV